MTTKTYVVRTDHCNCGKWSCMEDCVTSLFEFETEESARAFAHEATELQVKDSRASDYQVVPKVSSPEKELAVLKGFQEEDEEEGGYSDKKLKSEQE